VNPANPANLIRHDFAHPLRIDISADQVARAGYADHVNQLIVQLLLTSPGERVCLPEFGCGLRRLVFAPQTASLAPSVKIQVQQSIQRWLADQVALLDVSVLSGADPANGLDEDEFLVTVSYQLLELRSTATVTVKVV
jgi:Bacteriophage baseplate protein W